MTMAAGRFGLFGLLRVPSRLTRCPPADTPPTTIDTAVRSVRLFSGVLLCVLGVLAAVLLGLSWDNTAHAPHEDHEDVAATVVLLAVPLCLAIGWWACVRCGGVVERHLAHREEELAGFAASL